MEAAKYKILGSDYVGVFGTATDKFLFAGAGLTKNNRDLLAKTLGVDCVELTISGSDLTGLFSRANSKGIVLSNLALDFELEYLKKQKLGINICVMESDLNALGSNVLANDKIAIINPDYSSLEAKQIGDALDVEVIRSAIDGFKTVGANNILTNKGLVINNKATDEEKIQWDSYTHFDSLRTTANVGSLSIGIAAIANSNGIVVGDSTTGYEMARMVDALE
jgi:translation initiation factor 6